MQYAAEFMPKDQESLRILRERAKYIAAGLTEYAVSKNSIAYIRFSLNKNEQYGIPYQYIKKIIDNVQLSRVPYAPDFIAGVMNYHGGLIPVVDIKKYFHMQSIQESALANVVILITSGSTTLGILVDDVENNEVCDLDKLDQSLPFETGIKTSYIIGIHQGRVAILNIPIIVADFNLEFKK